MGKLADQLQAKLQPGMTIPGPLLRLYEWIEAKGAFIERDNGIRVACLFTREETETEGGTGIAFFAGEDDRLDLWLGNDDPEVLKRLCVFAKSGGDGSKAAFWIAGDGSQKIVHLGSGSGSTLACVLAHDAVDFLRLLAIGYDEICWDENFNTPPEIPVREGTPARLFQEWVEQSFQARIPKTASEIVEHPDSMDDDDPSDEFARWLSASNG